MLIVKLLDYIQSQTKSNPDLVHIIIIMHHFNSHFLESKFIQNILKNNMFYS